MEKRILIALLLTFLLLLLWSYIILLPRESKRETQPNVLISQIKEKKGIIYDTQKVKAIFSKNAGIISFKLKDYKETFFDEPVELASFSHPIKNILPLSFIYKDKVLSFQRQKNLFFSTSTRDIFIKKKIKPKNDYVIEVGLEFLNLKDKEILINDGEFGFFYFSLLEGVRNLSDAKLNLLSFKVKGGFVVSESLKKLSFKIGIFKEYLGKFESCGILSDYFLIFFKPSVYFSHIKFNDVCGILETACFFSGFVLGPKEKKQIKLSVYLGPLRYEELRGYKHIENLAKRDFLSNLIFCLLSFLCKQTGNWGVAIVGITFLIKLLFFPLSFYNLKVQKKMQKIQPIIEKLKEKYKKDTQGLSREIMLLYKRYKINPFSGCLPLLVQLPIFFALYTVLTTSIELRRAEFFGWIKDLSLPDPFYILPILMGVFMLIYQILSLKGQSPQLKKFTYIFSIVIMFLFLSFPAGLVLYWLTYNFLSLLEYLIVHAKIKSINEYCK